MRPGEPMIAALNVVVAGPGRGRLGRKDGIVPCVWVHSLGEVFGFPGY
jgi:hypothetical protein